MSKPGILAFAPHPWDDGPWMNRQNLLSRLAARGWPVVYSHGALSVWQRKGQQWNTAPLIDRIEAADGVSLVRPGRMTSRWPRLAMWDRWSIRRHCAVMKNALGENRRRIAAFCFDPSFARYVDQLNADWLFFHAYDVYSKMGQWDVQREKDFARLLERADCVTAATEAIADSLPLNSGRSVKILHNGADVSLFEKATELACPVDLASIPKPRIGNAGTLNRKMDFGLIAQIAMMRPEWQWVLVGRVAREEIENDPEARVGFARCLELTNVHVLGEKNRLDVPAYMGHMDVNTIAYRIRPNEWVSAGYPVKLNEYLAVGKPVVAAPQEAVVRHFGDIVSIPDDCISWISAIEAALGERADGAMTSRRKARAEENAWERRVDQLEGWMIDCINSVPSALSTK